MKTTQFESTTLDPNLQAVTQAIMMMANMQNQTSNRVTIVENTVDRVGLSIANLQSKIFTVDDIKNILKDFTSIKPEDITMANTMGYSVDENVEVLHMKEIEARLDRLRYVYGKSFGSTWEQKMFKAIGKTRKEVKIEAQVFMAKQGKSVNYLTFKNAVEEIPAYLKWGTVILLQIEKENHVFKRMYTRYELLSSGCSEFNPYIVNAMNKDDFSMWFNHRVRDFSEMCEVDSTRAQWLLYRAVSNCIKDRQKVIESFTEDERSDIEYIISHPNSRLREFFVYMITKCLVI